MAAISFSSASRKSPLELAQQEVVSLQTTSKAAALAAQPLVQSPALINRVMRCLNSINQVSDPVEQDKLYNQFYGAYTALNRMMPKTPESTSWNNWPSALAGAPDDPLVEQS
jgi:hypothetical protein